VSWEEAARYIADAEVWLQSSDPWRRWEVWHLPLCESSGTTRPSCPRCASRESTRRSRLE
jgi:hypothetical protein